MRTVSYRLADVAKVTIALGHVAENDATRVQIDAGQIFAEYPDAVPALTLTNPDSVSYPAVVVRDGNNVIWDVKDSDLAVPGTGEFQLTFTDNGTVVKSCIGKTKICRSIVGEGPAPDPVQDWIDRAEDVLEEIETAFPEGGTTGQVLAKKSDADFDTEWVDQGAGGVSDYDDLENRPQIGGVTLTGDKSLSDLGAASASEVSAKYTKPSGGIPATDIADGVIQDPTSIIDDTAGDGDTNKVWSADKVNELKSAIQQLPDVKSTFESSADLYVCDENGNVIAEFKNGHIVTKNFDSGNADILKNVAQDTVDLYICDGNGNVIAEFASGHIKTKYFDSKETATSGILNRVKDQTDGVYASCRWHQPSGSSKQFCLLLGGDSHYDPTRFASMIEYLNSVDAFDAGIMLGDMSGNTFSDSIAYYTDALENAQKPFLTVIGNHDVVGATSDSDLYTKYGDCFQYANLSSGEAVSGKCYYYKDFATYKIRVIVLMQYDYKYTGDICFGQDQIDWFIDVLNDTPSDYGVIIAEHTNPSRYMTYNLDSSVTSSTWYQSNYAPTLMVGDPIPDIVNAWINGTTLTQTYAYSFQNPPSDLSVSADFTDRGAGEFITYLGGHWHMNVLGTPTSYTDQNDYHVPAVGLTSATQGDMPRRSGTVSEDSLNVLAVDRDKKTVKIFQIGAHYTKDAVDRQYFKYSYGS